MVRVKNFSVLFKCGSKWARVKKLSGVVKGNGRRAFGRLHNRIHLMMSYHEMHYQYGLQVYKKRNDEELDLVIIWSQDYPSFQVEIYPTRLLNKTSSNCPNVEFGFKITKLEKAMSKAVSLNEQRKIFISINYSESKLSICDWKKIKSCRPVTLRDRQQVGDHVGTPPLPNRFVAFNEVNHMYDYLKENNATVARVSFKGDYCQITLGSGSSNDDDDDDDDDLGQDGQVASRLFHVTRRNPGPDDQEGGTWSLDVSKFIHIYENLPDPKPDLYFGGYELVEQVRNDSDEVVAVVRYRVYVNDVPASSDSSGDGSSASSGDGSSDTGDD